MTLANETTDVWCLVTTSLALVALNPGLDGNSIPASLSPGAGSSRFLGASWSAVTAAGITVASPKTLLGGLYQRLIEQSPPAPPSWLPSQFFPDSWAAPATVTARG